MKPQVWKHKENGKTYNVMPWFEIPDDFVAELKLQDTIKEKSDNWKDRQFKIGALIQVGWLLENEHGVWIGFGPTAKDSFDVVEDGQ